MTKLSAVLLLAAVGLTVYGSYLLHPAAAFLAGGVCCAGMGVLSLETGRHSK